jgi:hypothetical protein
LDENIISWFLKFCFACFLNQIISFWNFCTLFLFLSTISHKKESHKTYLKQLKLEYQSSQYLRCEYICFIVESASFNTEMCGVLDHMTTGGWGVKFFLRPFRIVQNYYKRWFSHASGKQRMLMTSPLFLTDRKRFGLFHIVFHTERWWIRKKVITIHLILRIDIWSSPHFFQYPISKAPNYYQINPPM